MGFPVSPTCEGLGRVSDQRRGPLASTPWGSHSPNTVGSDRGLEPYTRDPEP